MEQNIGKEAISMKFSLDLAAVMANPELSITSSPFTSKQIIKRASFRKGVVPEHLRQYLIPAGTGRGITGTAVYKGKKIPKVAVQLAMKYGRGR